MTYEELLARLRDDVARLVATHNELLKQVAEYEKMQEEVKRLRDVVETYDDRFATLYDEMRAKIPRPEDTVFAALYAKARAKPDKE